MRHLVLFVCSGAVLIGCGGSGGGTSGGGGPATNPNDITFETGSFEVPPGDSFTCFYTSQRTDQILSVTGASGDQGPGGHHITIYYTDQERPAEHHPCTDQEMVSWKQFAAAGIKGSEGAEGVIQLEQGLATKVPAGKQIVIQAHYINTTGKPMTTNDVITVHTTDPKDVVHYVNYFATLDETFEVPPNGSLKHVTECTVPQDLDAVMLLGHMHEWGTHYRIEREGGDALYDTKWVPLYTSHPPIDYFKMQAPLHLQKGDKLLQTCEWENNTPDPLTFPREMCLGYFYYFPDAGSIQCENKPVP